MKKWFRLLSAVLSLLFVLTTCGWAENALRPDDPAIIPENLTIDWNVRYSFDELEAQILAVADAYPAITNLYPIGYSWQNRALWCMEITNEAIDAAEKTGVSVMANIHGGERESASCAMYFMWWLALNSETEYVKNLLDAYIIYVIPVINPDGYVQSSVYNNRSNLRPRDANNNGIPFSDPYTDIDGDGYIATLYRGAADVTPSTRSLSRFGMESPDWDRNGLLGDDPRNSGIDLNRTFDFQWNRYDIDTTKTGVVGSNAWSSAGPSAASEPEVQAIQNFLIHTDIDALATLHTGIQCVLYPWCYRAYDEALDGNSDIPFMKETAVKMAAAYQETTGRGFYTMSSYEDYPTAAELIDYAYGRLNIHSYTIEVYCGGKSRSGDIADCYWENELPEATWAFYTQEQLTAMGLNVETIKDSNGVGLAEGEGLWFYTGATQQMVDRAPDDQITMVKGARDSLLVMIESEPYGEGWTVPAYLLW